MTMGAPSTVKASTIHITGRSQFNEELAQLDKMALSSPRSGEKEQQILDGLKQLGPRYVNTILAFSADRTAQNALDHYQVAKGVQTLIEQGVVANNSEAAFRNQAAIPEHGDQIKAYKTPYVGALFNSMFATFAGSTFFNDYLVHFRNFERNDVKPEISQLLRQASLPSAPRGERARRTDRPKN